MTAAGAGGVLNFKTKPDLDALSAGLPPGWRAMWDKSSGDVYYGNLATKVGLLYAQKRVWSCWWGWGAVRGCLGRSDGVLTACGFSLRAWAAV